MTTCVLPVLLEERVAARELGISVHTLRRIRQRGEIRAKKIGGRWKYRAEWIEAYIEDTDICPEKTDSRLDTSGSTVAQIPRCGAVAGSMSKQDRHDELLSARMILSKRN